MMKLVINLLRPFVRWLCRVWFRAEFHGVENIPATGACLITPNHASYADPIWVTVPIRRRVYYMAWDKPFKIPVLGQLMRIFGAFPVNVEAADASAQRAAHDVLRTGKALVIFPEGGRTRTGKLMPFKMGAFRFALTYGVPVVPVSISGGEKIWPVGKLFPRAAKLTVTFHPPVAVERLPEGTSRVELKSRARELARRTYEAVASAVAPDMRPDERGQASAAADKDFPPAEDIIPTRPAD
ncbi:MAG TPA: lysophospholipid acyltransferase family protein [Blastocatellia bacterium]|nr:lysophospholipid acyltransferase family protein [Blastocatellia bacterium]